MQPPSRSSDRPLLVIALGAMLLSLAGWLWIAAGARAANRSITPLPDGTGQAGSPAPSVPLQQPGDDGSSSATLIEPENGGRHEVMRRDMTMGAADILVRAEDQLTPIPDCELIYIDGHAEGDAGRRQ